MITIKSTTKKGAIFLNAYNGYNWYSDIYDAYEKPSYNKVTAWKDCQKQCKREGGRGCIIIGRNSCTFTVAWQTNEGLRVETAQNSYLIK